ncbi:hypothetical protein [uncultured Treponema sp.]|uniref:hypothetical protein n=1 Tax=uncultured Treponema sp. TaxID=162155 RepID=UPI0025F7CA89|nr:hypothetical protein [uncultured Treponema sp.]
MKKIVLLFEAIFSLFSFLSCSNLNDGEIAYIIPKVKGRLVDISVYSQDNIFSDPSRTLLPSALSSAYYYLFYIDTLSTNDTEYSYYGTVDLTYSSPTLATASVDFSPSVYRFILYASETEISSPTITKVAEKACLAGYTVADLCEVRQIVFYLSASSLSSTGTATITLSSNWTFPTSWDFSENGNSTATLGIYNVSTNEPISVGGININPYYMVYPTEIGNSLHLSNYTFANRQLPAGTYNFIVRFTNSDNNTSYEYNDLIMIFPNRNTDVNIEIPEIIEKIPGQPSDFVVTPNSPSSDSAEFYIADFSWIDNANNETGFEIQIADISSSYSNLTSSLPIFPSITSDSSWEESVYTFSSSIACYDVNSYKNYITYYFNYFDKDDSFSPDSYSLLHNNTQAKFYLRFGKRYAARIRSVNNAGVSAWTYAFFGDGSCSTINRFKVEYYGEGSVEIAYFSQSETGIQIQSPIDTNWLGWYISSISYDSEGIPNDLNKYPMTNNICDAYTGSENLVLIGLFNEESIAQSEYAWENYDILVNGLDDGNAVYFSTYLSGNTGTESQCEKGQYFELSKNDVDSLYWTLSSSAQSRNYKTVTLTLRKSSEDTIFYSELWDYSTKVWNTHIAGLENGFYVATFIATAEEYPNKKFNFIVMFKVKD